MLRGLITTSVGNVAERAHHLNFVCKPDQELLNLVLEEKT